MKNGEFSSLEKEKKQKKLFGVLKEKASKFLTDMEIEKIMESLDIDRQYAVKLYIDAVNFDSSCITSEDTEEVTYLSGRYFEPIIVICHSRVAGAQNSVSIIIPPCRMVTALQGSRVRERKDIS